ncbi:MAG TPA: D-aminoacylase [Hellea balneolensis]|uniref:D-aminoacylase n=1 Tax=Hellea balneolensis TaxID=287478 RepID=A0A7C5LSQ5_9PROT|nr:D-aminoacylase [Hellea balneolensis]
MYDLKIINGIVIDGTGAPGFKADIAIKDGKIVAIGQCDGEAQETIDAQGAIVTPGFIDLHTHYDGQISWDEELKPSVNHGVTTIVTGNCGVGFAPCRQNDHDKLVRLMEGVEDIPGTALHEGITWNWESFPDYMDALDAMPHTLDFALMLPHDPLRVYVMGDRAICEEQATPKDIETMKAITHEALAAGAVGFSTGRSDFHRSMDGDWTPASEAAPGELAGIASAFNDFDYGVLHAVNDFNQERPGDQFDEEFDILETFFRAAPGHKASMTLMQRDMVPDHWKRIIKRAEDLQKDGVDLRLQCAPRGIGVFLGLQSTFHPLMAFPSYIEIADKPLSERVELLRDPALKTKMLAETPVKLAGPGSSIPPMTDSMIAMTEMLSAKMFRLIPDAGGKLEYEQGYESSAHALAQKKGESVWSVLYDWLLEDDGKAMIYFPAYNYTDMNYNAVHTMMTHDLALPGLSDGGAHVGFICDASFPTYLLSYWTRDRKDKQIPLERAVQMLTADCADYLGLQDRGRLQIGKKADINIIDYENLNLHTPTMVYDLPAGSGRLLQPVSGYKATIVSGQPVVLDGEVTKARPGRLVRMGRVL